MTLKVWHCSDPPFKDISSALETSYFKQMVYQHQIPIQSVSTMHILYFWNANNIWLGILTLNIDTNIVQIKFCESRILFGQTWQGAPSKAEQLIEFHQSQDKAKIGFQSWKKSYVAQNCQNLVTVSSEWSPSLIVTIIIIIGFHQIQAEAGIWHLVRLKDTSDQNHPRLSRSIEKSIKCRRGTGKWLCCKM